VDPQKTAKTHLDPVFDFSLDRFRDFPGFASYKFVYHLTEDRLVIGPEDTPHRKIAKHAFGQDFGRSNTIGAYFDSQNKGDTISFKLLGKSGYFGRPTKAHLRLAAQHIARQLEDVEITETENHVVIKGKFATQ